MRPNLLSTALAAAVLVSFCPQAHAGRSRPLETGQRISHGAAGDSTVGISRRYKDAAKVVTDLRTGLTWRKYLFIPNEDYEPESTGSWSASPGLWDTDGETFDGESFDGEAAALLSRMNTEPCFEGFCDWRLPTVTELFTLVNFGPERVEAYATIPAKDGLAITWPFHSVCDCEPSFMTAMSWARWKQSCMAGNCSCTAKGPYWSSTTSPIDPGKAMAVDFTTGEVRAYPKSIWFHVRPVRGGKRSE